MYHVARLSFSFTGRTTRQTSHRVIGFQVRIPGLSDKDKEIRFTSGLPHYIFKNLATGGNPPKDFAEWIARSLTSYAAFSRVRERELAEKKTSSSTTAARPSTSTAAPRYTAPAPTHSGTRSTAA